jgi:hypothetical protein
VENIKNTNMSARGRGENRPPPPPTNRSERNIITQTTETYKILTPHDFEHFVLRSKISLMSIAFTLSI